MYLGGKNAVKRAFVKPIEVIPDETEVKEVIFEEPIEIEKPKEVTKRRTRKKKE